MKTGEPGSSGEMKKEDVNRAGKIKNKTAAMHRENPVCGGCFYAVIYADLNEKLNSNCVFYAAHERLHQKKEHMFDKGLAHVEIS